MAVPERWRPSLPEGLAGQRPAVQTTIDEEKVGRNGCSRSDRFFFASF